jgi:hypothetical protein
MKNGRKRHRKGKGERREEIEKKREKKCQKG